jgi:hypothetical protein
MKTAPATKSGKCGTHVAYRGRYGYVRRTLVTPANPRSPAQTAVRCLLAHVAARWRLLTTPQHAAWTRVASQEWSRPRARRHRTLTGHQLFAKINCTLALLGRKELADPPVRPQFPALPTLRLLITPPDDRLPRKLGNIQQLTANAQHPTNAPGTPVGCSRLDVGSWMFPASGSGVERANKPWRVTLALKLACPLPPGSTLLIRASAPLPSGRRACDKFRLLGTCPAPGTGLADLTALYAARFGLPKPNQRIFLQVSLFADGWVSKPTTIHARVPAPSKPQRPSVPSPSTPLAKPGRTGTRRLYPRPRCSRPEPPTQTRFCRPPRPAEPALASAHKACPNHQSQPPSSLRQPQRLTPPTRTSHPSHAWPMPKNLRAPRPPGTVALANVKAS